MKIKSTLSALPSSAVLLMGAQTLLAGASSCKGMEQASCAESSSCRWVKSYQRSDGREINGYCRKLPGKQIKDASVQQETTDPATDPVVEKS